MDYRNAFAISATGMDVEKMRLDVTATNLANAHSTRGADGKLFRPLQVNVSQGTRNFAVGFEKMMNVRLHGAQAVRIEETETVPRQVYDPGNPAADERGFVSTPGVNQVTEMVNLSLAIRSYEANVVAMNAAKTMALKALELGGA